MSIENLMQGLKSGLLDGQKNELHNFFSDADHNLKLAFDAVRSGTALKSSEDDIPDLALLAFWAEYGADGMPDDIRDVLKLLQDFGFVPKPKIAPEHYHEMCREDGGWPYVSANGSIYGTRPFEQINWQWVYAVLNNLLTDVHGKAPFNTNPAEIALPTSFSLAILGDWGTGFEKDDISLPAKSVLDIARSLSPTYMIHLGDVYYTGQPRESVATYLPKTQHPAELSRFVTPWSEKNPPPSFTLNSNHEMYCGAWGYFNDALQAPVFAGQKGCSYFALHNDHWLILGLDSAYVATDFYQQGRLNHDQKQWAQKLVATNIGRKILVMTHHNGTKQRHIGCETQARPGGGEEPAERTRST